MPQVYAVVHNGRGDFMIAFKNLKGYFFHAPGGGGSIIPAGQLLNGGNNWAFPGGALDAGPINPATVIAGAIRELQEETGIDAGAFTCAPLQFGGGAYYGVYFRVEENFSSVVQQAHTRLLGGQQAADAVKNGTYTRNDQYAALMEAFHCPEDNELSDVYPWNLYNNWDDILRLREDHRTDWFYYILKHLRDQLGVTIIDLTGLTVGVGSGLVFEPGPQYVVSNLVFNEARLIPEGEYVLFYEGQRYEHVLFNGETVQGGTSIFTQRE